MEEEQKASHHDMSQQMKLLDELEGDKGLLESMDFIRFVHVFRKSIWLIVLVFLITLTCSYLYIRYTRDLYEASSTLKLEMKSDAGVLGLNIQEDKHSQQLSDLSGEIEIIKSKMIYDEVIENMGLQTSYYQEGNVLYEEKYTSSPFYVTFEENNNKIIYDKPIKITIQDNQKFLLETTEGETGFDYTKQHTFGETVNLKGFRFVVSKSSHCNSGNYNIPYFFKIHSYQALKSYFNKNLNVEVLNMNAKTIEVSFTDHNSSKARDIVNAIDTVYLRKTIEKKQRVQEQTIEFINQQLDSTANQLERAENNLENFYRKIKSSNPGAELSRAVEKIEELEQKKEELRDVLGLLNKMETSVNHETNNDMEEFIPMMHGMEDQQLNEYIKTLNEARTSFNKLKSTTKPTSLAYQNHKREIESLTKNIKEYIKQNKSVIYDEIISIQTKLSELHDKLLSIPSKETELTRLKRSYSLFEKFYLMLKEKKVEFGIAKAGTVPEFVILSPANTPNQPISPKVIQVYAIGAGGGVFLSILLLLINFISHNKIISEKELEAGIPAPILGVIPRYKKEKMLVSRLVVHDNPKSSLSESFRNIRTNIDFICNKETDRLITVTSTVSGEGKTFVSINLAGVLAMTGHKVVILDLDLRKPKVHQAFNVDNEKGISTILIGRDAWKDCVSETDVDSLDFISAGPVPPNPSELIMKNEFNDLLKELSEVYDHIIIDTPPTGLVTDGLLIMKKANLSIYVIRADYSHKGVEKNINKLIKTGQFPHLSLLLNSVSENTGYGYGYGYGYGKGYGAYYEEGNEKKSFLSRIFKRN